MNGSIYEQLNRQNSFQNFKRLSEFLDDVLLEAYEADGYYAGMTAPAWKERFPSVPAEKIIVLKTVLFPPNLYYYDEAAGICFDTRISNGEVLSLGKGVDDSAYDKKLAGYVEKMEEHRRKREYRPLLMSVESEGSGNMVMQLLIRYLLDDEPNEALYESFVTEYGFCDCGAALFDDPLIFERLVACKSEAQKEETEERMLSDGLADDIITVYRGEASKSTPYQKAISWTTDLNRAFFFAGWRGCDGSRVVTGKVRRRDVLEYIPDRDESELLVLPGKVFDIDIQNCVSMDIFKQTIAGGIEGFSPDLSDYCAAEVYRYTRDVYDCREDDICDHDDLHSIRVGLLAAFLFRIHTVCEYISSPLAKSNVLSKVNKGLFLACAWHDYGRYDNAVNEDHGTRSCEAFLENHKDDKIARFFMEYHCRSDEDARAFWKKKFSATKGADIIWDAFCIMKDADALDRCRFGNLSEDYVDVAYLRLRESKLLLPVAQALQHVVFQ